MTQLLVETALQLGAVSLQYTAGSLVVLPGDTPQWCFVIQKGSVRQYDIRDNGTELTLNIYRAGTVLTLPWLFHSTANTHFFQCIEDCVLLRLPRQQLQEAFKTNLQLSYETLSRVARGLDGVLGRLSAHSTSGAAHTVLSELTLEAARFGTSHPEGIAVHLRVQDLAHRTGLARETVSRALSTLAKKQLIKPIKGGYVVPNHMRRAIYEPVCTDMQRRLLNL